MQNTDEEFDRFTCDFNYVNFINNKEEPDKIIDKKLELGDIVKLKGVNYTIQVQHINF